MQEECKNSFGVSLSKTLSNLIMLFTKLRTLPVLRKEGALNITLKPEELLKPIVDKFHFQGVHSSQMTLWIAYGYLVYPEALAIPGAVELVKLVLSESFLFPVFRNTVLLNSLLFI